MMLMAWRTNSQGVRKSLSSVSNLRKIFDQPEGAPLPIPSNPLQRRRPTIDGLPQAGYSSISRKRHLSFSKFNDPSQLDDLPEGALPPAPHLEENQGSGSTSPNYINPRTPTDSPQAQRPAYGIRNYAVTRSNTLSSSERPVYTRPGVGGRVIAPVEQTTSTGQALDRQLQSEAFAAEFEYKKAKLKEKKKKHEQEVSAWEESKKSFNDQFSRFLTKKEEFMDKVEQFESEKSAFESERRQFSFQKQILEEDQTKLKVQQDNLASDKASLLQKQEQLLKEQQELQQKKNSWEVEKKGFSLSQAAQTKSSEVDQMTTQIADLTRQIDSQNQTHLVLQQLIDSLTLQLQQEQSTNQKLKAEFDEVNVNMSRAKRQSDMMQEEYSSAKAERAEWKKKEKKLKANNKALTDSMKHFIQEREILNKDREQFEKIKLSLIEAELSIGLPKEERWDDKAWVQIETKRIQTDRQKVTVVKRYTEQERLRVGEMKKRLEANQAEFDQMKLDLAKLKDRNLTGPSSDIKRRKTKTNSSNGIDKKKVVSRINLAEAVSGDGPESDGAFSPKSKTHKKTDSGDGKDKSGSGKTPKLSDRKPDPDEYIECPNPPPGDVFKISHLPITTIKPEKIAQILSHNEVADFRTQTLNEGAIVKASLRCCLRRIGCLSEDYDFHFTFFTIHDYFIDPVTLFKTIVLFYRSGLVPLLAREANSNIQPQNAAEQNILENQLLAKYQDSLIAALIMWMGFRFESLTSNEEFRTNLVKFLLYLNHPSANANHASDLKKAWNYLEEMCKQFNDGKAALFKLSTGPPNGLQLLSLDTKILAEQLTLEEQASFQNIELTDYYQRSWENNPESNITAMMTRFDRMVNWYLSLIISAHGDAEKAKILGKLIEIMNELKTLRNFNSLMQVYTALTKDAVQNLKKAWSMVLKPELALFTKTGQFMSPSNKFGTYRAYLDEIEENSPCIPYHALLLRDLTVIESTCELCDEQGRVLFDTLSILADVFQRLQDFRSVLYSLDEDSKIQIFLHNRQILVQSEIDAFLDTKPSETPSSGTSSPTSSKSRSTKSVPDKKTHVSKSPSKSQIASAEATKEPTTPRVEELGVRKTKSRTNITKADSSKTGATRPPVLVWEQVDPGSSICQSFMKFLPTSNERWALECWEKCVDLKRTEFGNSAMDYITWQETGEEIVSIYFASDATKPLEYNFPSKDLDSIVNGFCLGSIIPDLMDPIIQICADVVAASWKDFVAQTA